ncbi:MAG: serine/threonine protein kinase [Deltaproteobacteria bacterium]|nr:serine/threonine protein kinase [Deltaproteobacteria bacterium]
MSAPRPRVGATTGPGDASAGVVARRYRLGPLLGRGGGGAVHRARDLLHGADVAIKLAAGPPGLLRDEFEVTRAFAHPHVVAVHASGRADDAHDYLVMELLTGSSLEAVVAAGPVDGAYLARLALGCALALDHVHRRGVVHGDIKPANIWVDAGPPGDPRPKLLDFGLATRGDGAPRGTLAYLAPELLERAAPTAASDLYALGVTLAEAALGRNPYAAATRVETLERVHQGVALTLPDALPPRLAELVARLVDREPARRPATAGAVVAALLELPELALDARATAHPLATGPWIDHAGRGQARDAVVAALRPDGPAATVVTGPEGVGRTRLLDELEARAGLAGVPLLRIGGRRADDEPLRDLLHGLAVLWPDVYRAAVAARPALPWWVRRPCAEADTRDAVSGAQAAELVAAVVAAEPLVVAWDDVDAASADDLALLRALLPALARAPRHVVLTQRRPVPRLDDALAALDGRADVTLAPLDEAGVGAFLDLVAGPTARRDELAARLHAATGGTPGDLALALSHHLAEGRLTSHEGRVVASPAFWHLAPPPSAPRARPRTQASPSPSAPPPATSPPSPRSSPSPATATSSPRPARPRRRAREALLAELVAAGVLARPPRRRRSPLHRAPPARRPRGARRRAARRDLAAAAAALEETLPDAVVEAARLHELAGDVAAARASRASPSRAASGPSPRVARPRRRLLPRGARPPAHPRRPRERPRARRRRRARPRRGGRRRPPLRRPRGGQRGAAPRGAPQARLEPRPRGAPRRRRRRALRRPHRL